MRQVKWNTALCLAVKAFWIVLTKTHGMRVYPGLEFSYRISVVQEKRSFWRCQV